MACFETTVTSSYWMTNNRWRGARGDLRKRYKRTQTNTGIFTSLTDLRSGRTGRFALRLRTAARRPGLLPSVVEAVGKPGGAIRRIGACEFEKLLPFEFV